MASGTKQRGSGSGAMLPVGCSLRLSRQWHLAKDKRLTLNEDTWALRDHGHEGRPTPTQEHVSPGDLEPPVGMPGRSKE